MRFMSLVICFKLHRSVVVVWSNHFRLVVPYNWRNCRHKGMKKPLEERNNLIIILNGHHNFKSQLGSSLWVFSFNSCTSLRANFRHDKKSHISNPCPFKSYLVSPLHLYVPCVWMFKAQFPRKKSTSNFSKCTSALPASTRHYFLKPLHLMNSIQLLTKQHLLARTNE